MTGLKCGGNDVLEEEAYSSLIDGIVRVRTHTHFAHRNIILLSFTVQ